MRWAYSNATGFDVLARIVEVASGEHFDAFIKRRLFEPLGMQSSSFGPRRDLAERTMSVDAGMASNPCVNGETFFCGSAGLWASAEDYSHFAQMLLNGGEFNGKRLLGEQSIRLMASNQTGDLFTGSSGVPGFSDGVGFGLSVVVVMKNAAASGLSVPIGSYGWDGVGSRRFWVIPSERMTIVMLVPSGNAVPVQRDIERAALSAIGTL
jgi:CubicO group peptidase (beta-lactamase class C family)